MARTARAGYSLIEVLWVMAIVSFLLAGMGELILRSFQAARTAEETSRKAALLSAALEGLKARPFKDAGLAAGEYGEAGELFPGGRAVRSEWLIGEPAAGLRKNEFRLFFQGQNDRAIRSALLISEALGF